MSLRDGFEQLRWGMTRGALRVVYPAARTTPLIEGRHPVTGARVFAGGEELVPAIREVAHGLALNATVGFEDDALAQIDLWPDLPPALPEPRSLDDGQLLIAVRRLARSFGRDGLVEIPQEARWESDGVIVMLRNENGFLFELFRR